MRRVPLDKIQEGYRVGKTIYTNEGKILLQAGSELTERKINHLTKVGYTSLYIVDELSDEVLEDLVDSKVRIDSIKSVKNVFDSFRNHQKYLSKINASTMKKQKKIEYQNAAIMQSSAINIVDDLLNKKHSVINVVDIKSNNGYLYQHSVNVAVLAVTFGMKLGLSMNKLRDLAVGGMMHDIGYNLIDYDSFNNAEPLDDEKRKTIHTHPKEGYEYLKDNMDINAHVRMIVYQHHEWINGEGYPQGIKGTDITELARIVAITDMYDALTSDRPYRKAYSVQEATEYLLASSLHQLDFELVKEFVKIIIPYPIGTVVKLTNGEIGVVIEVDVDYPLRPKVKIVKQVSHKIQLYIRDLMKEYNVLIDDVQYELPQLLIKSEVK